MADAISFKYRAFISYSHTDSGWAKWLHRGLESFRIDKDLVGRETATGTIPLALRPIFRDRDDFTAGHTLTEQTQAALNASAALIVICSPLSAKSFYVNEEVRSFKSLYRNRPVIPLIVAGKPGDPKLECFPPALKFKLDAKGRITKKPVEMLAADAREEGDGKDLSLTKVIAGLLGLSSDDVFRRAERERRAVTRRRRRVQALFGVLILLLAAAGVGWLNQEYLMEQYYWFAMGPTVLTEDEERALQPKDEFRECTSGCPLMVVVPAGKFIMGSPAGQGEDIERPQHEVTIARFAVGKYEVTFAQWDMCVAASGCPQVPDTIEGFNVWDRESGVGRGERPVINVRREQAQQYVTWLTGLTGNIYRLLTEAEWEYAERAGTTTLYSFGDDEAALGEYAWYHDNAGGMTHPVGEKKPNPFGLYDMHGNVQEWVEDDWHSTYDGAPSDGSAWFGEDVGRQTLGVVRGGYWNSGPDTERSAFRGWFLADDRYVGIGFRVGRTLTP